MTVDILILGATGTTGRQTALYLDKHPQRSLFTFAVAGRSKAKLDSVVAELDSAVPVFIFDVNDADQVDRVVQNAKIIINTVGPYWRWGTPVVKYGTLPSLKQLTVGRACVTHRVCYVDLTGEYHWIKKLLQP